MRSVLGPVVQKLEEKHGKGKWLAVYGGDTALLEKPDLGACIEWMKQDFSPLVMSVQGWEECDNFVDFMFRYEEEKDAKGRTVYGGVIEGQLVGGSKVYLGETFRTLLTAVIDVDAKGRVGSQELEFAKEKGLKIVRVAPANQRFTY